MARAWSRCWRLPHYCASVRVRHAMPFVFIGNVGEEGEGDLRGMRHIFSTPRWKDSIAYSLVLDGAGADTIVAEALGSRRFEVIVRGPGGHSWSDFGAPNPIVILAKAIETFTATTVPSNAKDYFQHRGDSRWNVGEFDSGIGQHEGRHSFDFDGGDGATRTIVASGPEPRRRRRNHDVGNAFAGAKASFGSELRSGGDRKSSGRRVASWARASCRSCVPSMRSYPIGAGATSVD